MNARFGPAGSSNSFLQQKKHTSIDAPQWLHENGLNALEIQFGRGVSMGETTAKTLGERAKKFGVQLSVHSPYYISLSSFNEESLEKNLRYIRQSAQAAAWMCAQRVVVHAGSVPKGLERTAALEKSYETLVAALGMLDELALDTITLCIETMGKVNQLGTLSEVLELCKRLPRLQPCVDFGHIYARQQGVIDYNECLNEIEAAIGLEKAQQLHVHFAKMEYSKGGEVRHLTFENDEFGPDFASLAAIFAQRGYTPTIICESAGTQAEDAKAMRDMYMHECSTSETI